VITHRLQSPGRTHLPRRDEPGERPETSLRRREEILLELLERLRGGDRLKPGMSCGMGSLHGSQFPLKIRKIGRMKAPKRLLQGI
jgi:hypothetical protein